MGDADRMAWLRAQVRSRLEAARRADTGELWEAEKHYDGLWLVDLTPGAGMLGDVDEIREAHVPVPGASMFESPRFLWAFVHHARHIAENGPQDVIARCEAELEILASHRVCVCSTVKTLAKGYRHKPGYEEHWGSLK